MNKFINIIKSIVLFLLLNNYCYPQMNMDWVRRYSGPGNYEDSGNAIYVDDYGNVYVTGTVQAGSGFICTTIKYNKYGDSLWVRNYLRPGNSYNYGLDIVVDDSGSVFVAGAESVIKYDKIGNLKWTKFDSANFSKIILDSSGNIYTCGMGYGSFVTVKYDKNGNRIWKNSGYLGYRLRDMVLDKFGNVIITGQSEYVGTFQDYTTIKYSNNGNLKWVRTYNGPAPPLSYDVAYAVTADNSGNVYVTGASMNEMSQFECVTVKYDSLGNVIWIKRIPVSANIADSGHDILTDSSQNVYIAAWLNGHTSTIKLNPDGNIIWSRVFSEGDGFATNFPVLILDSINNVYVTAISNSFNADYAAIKYDNNGNQVFVVTYSNSIGSIDYVYDIAIERNGNLYLTGASQGSYYDYSTVKFSPIILGISGNSIQPSEYKLEQNYPNPFNPSTNLEFGIFPRGRIRAELGFVTLKVYDLLGKEVAVLVNENKPAGNYKVEWNASDFPSGVYLYKLEVDGNIIDTKRMILLK